MLSALAMLILLVIGSSGVFYFSSFNYLQRQGLLQTGEHNPYGDHTGTLVLNDPLRDNSNGYSWSDGSDQNGSCQFTAEVYRIQTNVNNIWKGCDASPSFNNFTYEVQMSINHGRYGGVLFGGNMVHDRSYYLRISSNGFCNLFVYHGNITGNLLFSTDGSIRFHSLPQFIQEQEQPI